MTIGHMIVAITIADIFFISCLGGLGGVRTLVLNKHQLKDYMLSLILRNVINL